MANEENLKPFDKLTESEQREIARKGGIRSAEVRREKKLFKDEILKRMKESDWEEMIDGVIARAKNSDKGFEVLRDTVGQKPKEEVNAQVENIIKVKLNDHSRD